MCGIFVYKGEGSASELEKQFMKLAHRGPDSKAFVGNNGIYVGFHRLSIMDTSTDAMQPFYGATSETMLVCNGEVYNYSQLRKEFTNHKYKSSSDCEVILPMLEKLGIEETCKKLDAEFAFVYTDTENGRLLAARDPIGIRPLFYGKHETGWAFASEAKALTEICDEVKPFPPGHYFDGNAFISYRSMIHQEPQPMSMDEVLKGIAEKLEAGVVKRLQSDVPVGFLLSGGLDSSLVCALAAKHFNRPIKTFSVGSVIDAIDNKYAEEVSKYIGSDHTTVTFTQEEVYECLEELVRMLETWDVTTVRASIGMYLVCKWIRKNTDIKVLLTGEVSDELFGYKYTDFAPSPNEFQEEAKKRIRELHLYDVLRADRCIAAHSLEARVPFGDLDFVDHVMAIPAEMKMNTYGQGKYLLRKAFDGAGLLPNSILYREKAAFSDAVGHSVADGIKEKAEHMFRDDFHTGQNRCAYHGKPLTREGLYYRQLFEKHYPGRAKLIKALWLPNTSWENCDVIDPSARVLPNYGKSGK
jgi:asparagine synthase (glutamine-hydrolysing)